MSTMMTWTPPTFSAAENSVAGALFSPYLFTQKSTLAPLEPYPILAKCILKPWEARGRLWSPGHGFLLSLEEDSCVVARAQCPQD